MNHVAHPISLSWLACKTKATDEAPQDSSVALTASEATVESKPPTTDEAESGSGSTILMAVFPLFLCMLSIFVTWTFCL